MFIYVRVNINYPIDILVTLTDKGKGDVCLVNHSTFPIFRNFLPNHGNGSQPLNINAGRILPGFGRKIGNIGKLDYLYCYRC